MNGLQTVLDEVMWEEGMLLAPQHFQQAAIRGEELLHYHIRAAAPWHWGVREVAIDPIHLPSGLFRVTRLEAVMPDGLPLLRTGAEADALELDLTEHAEDARPGPLTVWLTVPARRAPGEPFAGNLPRYDFVDGRPIPDEYTGEGAVAVRRLRPRATLRAGTLPSSAYVAFPLARVVLADEKFVLADYEPPRMAASPGRFPHRECAEVARRVRRKAGVLAARGDDARRTDDEVRILGAGLPQLEAVLATGAAHPFALYLALCTLAGHLAGVAPRGVPPAFPAYDHDDLRATFAPVLAFCGAMLERVSETHVAIPFRPGAAGELELVLRPEWTAPGELVVGVTAPGGGTEAEAAEWLEECRIGSAGRMEAIRDRRVPGAARERVRDTSRVGFVPGRGEVLFRLAADPEWVAAGEPLVITNPRDPAGRRRPRAVVLYTRNA